MKLSCWNFQHRRLDLPLQLVKWILNPYPAKNWKSSGQETAVARWLERYYFTFKTFRPQVQIPLPNNNSWWVFVISLSDIYIYIYKPCCTQHLIWITVIQFHTFTYFTDDHFKGSLLWSNFFNYYQKLAIHFPYVDMLCSWPKTKDTKCANAPQKSA